MNSKRYGKLMILVLAMSLFLIIPASFASDNLTMAESAEIEADEPAEVPVLEATDDSEVVSGSMDVVYVNAENGTDEGSGTETDPVRTISKGFDLVKDYGTVYLAGTFKGDGNSELSFFGRQQNAEISFIGLGDTIIDCENVSKFSTAYVRIMFNPYADDVYYCFITFENILFIVDDNNADRLLQTGVDSYYHVYDSYGSGYTLKNCFFKQRMEISANNTEIAAGEIAAINITTPRNSNGTCLIEYNGTNYTGDFKNGIATIEIPNLKVGDYEFTVQFIGDDQFLPKNTTAIVKVKKMPTFLNAETFEMYRGDGTKYQINLTDRNGNPVVGMGIKVNITGKTYTIITDENGTAVLPINLKQGIHPVTAFFNGKGDYVNATAVSTDVNVLTKVRIDQHRDLVKDYGDADKFTVHAVDKYGKSVGANAKVNMTIAGKTYTVFTDAQGYASLPINLKPGTYDITCEYAGYSVTHKITVKQVLSATNRQYKKAATYQFTATLKHANGNPITGKTVNFNFKGKSYTATTNSKGEATITIKEALNLGSYNIAIKYLDSTIKKTITIK